MENIIMIERALTIGAIAISFIVIIIYILKKISEANMKAAKFLSGTKDVLYDRLLLILKEYNYDSKESIVGIESEIIEKGITELKKILTRLIEESAVHMSKLERYLLLKTVDNFISSIINQIDIPATIDNINKDRYESAESTFAEEDKHLQEEYSNSNLYIDDDKELDNIDFNINDKGILEEDKDGIEKRGFTLPNKEEESQLLPQSESEESYDSEDISMEIIPDNVFVDAKGRLHDKTTGRYIKEV